MGPGGGMGGLGGLLLVPFEAGGVGGVGALGKVPDWDAGSEESSVSPSMAPCIVGSLLIGGGFIAPVLGLVGGVCGEGPAGTGGMVLPPAQIPEIDSRKAAASGLPAHSL
jgi:hypothetical protein